MEQRRELVCPHDSNAVQHFRYDRAISSQLEVYAAHKKNATMEQLSTHTHDPNHLLNSVRGRPILATKFRLVQNSEYESVRLHERMAVVIVHHHNSGLRVAERAWRYRSPDQPSYCWRNPNWHPTCCSYAARDQAHTKSQKFMTLT